MITLVEENCPFCEDSAVVVLLILTCSEMFKGGLSFTELQLFYLNV